MNLGQIKKLLYGIIDDAKPKTDTQEKLLRFLSQGQQEIALFYPVYKTALYPMGEPRALPKGFYKGVRCEAAGGYCVPFSVKDGQLVCAQNDISLLYEERVEDIPQGAPDTYELSLYNEAALTLALFVAAQLNNNEDNSGAFQSYYAQFQGNLLNLASQPVQALATVMLERGSNVYSL